jgi:putative intracellular protease/amidase
LLEGARNGECGIIAIFEKRPSEYLGTTPHSEEFARLVAEKKIEILYLRPLDLSIDETLAALRDAVLRTGARRAVIDSLSGLELALAPTFRTDFRESLYRMLGSLTALGVTVMATVELTDSYTDFRLSPQDVSFLTDAVIIQRNEALAAGADPSSLPAVPPELDPINEYSSFLQNPVSLRDIVRDSYPRPKQGEDVRDDFAARLEPDLAALDQFAGMAWVGGGGAIGDFGNNTRDWVLLEAFIKGGKPVVGICYGSIALSQVKDSLTGAYLLQGHFATGHGEADNYTEDTATMNPDGTYNPSVSGAAPINLSDMLKQAIGSEQGGYVMELDQAPMAVMSGGAIITGNTVEDGDSTADLLLASRLGGLTGDYFIAGDERGRALTRDDPAVARVARVLG